MLQSPDMPAAVVATTITVWGIATGLSYEVLLAGFAGGLVSLSFIPALGTWRRIWTPVTATLTAGYTAPIAEHYIAGFLGDGIEGLAVRGFAAFVVGLLAQVALPLAIRFAERKISQVAE